MKSKAELQANLLEREIETLHKYLNEYVDNIENDIVCSSDFKKSLYKSLKEARQLCQKVAIYL